MKRNAVTCIAGLLGLSLLALVSLSPASAKADDVLYYFNTTFSGTRPTGSNPWATLEIKDITAGTVSLTFSGSGLQGSEYVDELFLNLNPSLNPNSLAFTQTATTGNFIIPCIKTGENAYQAGGSSQFDIQFNFATANADRFVLGDSVTYQITGIPYLNADDFKFTSENGGGTGQWLAAVHINSIAPNLLSGWDAPAQVTPVPEPAPTILVITATGLYAGARRLRNSIGKS